MKRISFSRKGAVILLLTFSLGVSANLIAVQFWSDARDELGAAEVVSEGYRATLLAKAGVESAIAAIKTVPEEFIFRSKLAIEPPDIFVEQCKPKCFISYRLQPEDGRLNLNYLVRQSDDQPSMQFKMIFERFFAGYGIPLDRVDSLIDWIDRNDTPTGNGGESRYYAALNPPRKVKNFPLFTLSEVVLIKGITYQMIYSSRKPTGDKENSTSFLTEDEKELIAEDDWIPANNLTAFYLPDMVGSDKINVNSARYHVLLSLSEMMRKETVLAIFRERRKQRGYIKDIRSLKNLPELEVKTSRGISLYEELAGGGSDNPVAAATADKTNQNQNQNQAVTGNEQRLSGILKTEGSIYRITGVGSLLPASDNETGGVVRRVTVLYDKARRSIVFYSED